jgi:hypothetical protein
MMILSLGFCLVYFIPLLLEPEMLIQASEIMEPIMQLEIAIPIVQPTLYQLVSLWVFTLACHTMSTSLPSARLLIDVFMLIELIICYLK